jgi:hypothetical protein
MKFRRDNADGQVTITEAAPALPASIDPVPDDLTESQRAGVDVLAQLAAQAHARREAEIAAVYAREARAKREREQAAKDAAEAEKRAYAAFLRDYRRNLAAQVEATRRGDG